MAAQIETAGSQFDYFQKGFNLSDARIHLPDAGCDVFLRPGSLEIPDVGRLYFDAYIPSEVLRGEKDIEKLVIPVHGSAGWPQTEKNGYLRLDGNIIEGRNYFDRMLPHLRRPDTAIIFPRMPGGGGSNVHFAQIAGDRKSLLDFGHISGYLDNSVKSWAMVLSIFTNHLMETLEVSPQNVLIVGYSMGGQAAILAKGWGMEGKVAAMSPACKQTIKKEKQIAILPIDFACSLEERQRSLVFVRRPIYAAASLLRPIFSRKNGTGNDGFRANAHLENTPESIVAAGISMFNDPLTNNLSDILAALPNKAKEDIFLSGSTGDDSISLEALESIAANLDLRFSVVGTRHDSPRTNPAAVASYLAGIMDIHSPAAV